MLKCWETDSHWQQCGLARDRNDQYGSCLAGTSEETPDSKIKDGEHFNPEQKYS